MSEGHEFITGVNLANTVKKMIAVTEGLNPDLVYASCLAMALMSQDGDIANDKLRDGILALSKWIRDYLGPIREPEIPKEQLN